MGLNTNIRNIENTLTASQTQKQQKEAEKLKIRTEKENIKRLQYDIIKGLYNDFYREILKNNVDITEFYRIEKKQEILQDFLNNYAKTYNQKQIAIDTFNNNYFKILSQIEKEYKYNQKYYEKKQKEAKQKEAELLKIQQEKEQQEEEKQQKKLFAINVTIKILLIMILLPLYLLIMLFVGICKGK